MKKLALGVHHFNLTYVAGQRDTYHRQVREAIGPFLDLLIDHPAWRMDVEIQGYAVEFMAAHYPEVLEKLRYLSEDTGQVELISCHYSPQLWVAFPRYDMQKSIRMNDEILKRHGLRRSRIFFAQENFSGEGVRELSREILLREKDPAAPEPVPHRVLSKWRISGCRRHIRLPAERQALQAGVFSISPDQHGRSVGRKAPQVLLDQGPHGNGRGF